MWSSRGSVTGMGLVDYSFADDTARITLVDPERGNPLHPASVHELRGAVRRAGADQARVIVLAATGRFFCVGGDLPAFAGAADMGELVDDLAAELHQVISELVRSEAIVVSVVQGAAAGAGFPLAMAADLVVAADAASFTCAYTKVGLSVDGSTSLLVHSIGLHRALRLALLNDTMTAEEAHLAGLVARVVPAAELDAAVDDVVARVLTSAPVALALTKRLLRDVAEPAPESAMRLEAIGIRAAATTSDAREGVSAFVEKRAPRFGPQQH